MGHCVAAWPVQSHARSIVQGIMSDPWNGQQMSRVTSGSNKRTQMMGDSKPCWDTQCSLMWASCRSTQTVQVS